MAYIWNFFAQRHIKYIVVLHILNIHNQFKFARKDILNDNK